MKTSGFTLIELTVVLLIAGIVATAVTLKMSGPVSRAKLQDIVERIRQFDSHTRSYARQQGKALQVEVDLSRNSISRLDKTGQLIGRPLNLPSGFSIEKCHVASRQETSDMALLKYSTQGLSCSYALEITDKLYSKWLLIVGFTGEGVELENEIKVKKILESLSWDDTD